MTKDIELYENGNGGELNISNNDIQLNETLYQTIYIALFGGNTEASTVGNENDSDQRFDFWANSLFFADKTNKQYNSDTQKTLSEVTTNSSGRLKIKQAVENDLSFLSSIVTFEVEVSIISINKIEIIISLSNGSELQFIWDNASDEVITNNTI